MEFQDFFLVKAVAVKVGSNRKKYLDLTLGDATGEISAKKWDIEDAELQSIGRIEVGKVIKIRASVTEWKGGKQLRVTRIRMSNEQDGLSKRDFFKAAPEAPEDMYEFITGKIRTFEDEELRRLCLDLYEENKERLMYYPAAMSNHHAEYAGLLYHVKRMMMMGERACEVYTNLSKDLLLAGVAIHDIEKLNEILSDENGMSPGYSFEGQMLGHIVHGVRLIAEKCKALGIGEEKSILLQHMILSHHYEPEFGSPRKPLFPEAEMLHYLDMVDAKMFDMEDALAGVEPGGFGERVWTLDNRKLYKRTF
ncbi:MAG: HD domain-containing protein [Mogibacterium sp.]|nr:HD domain-containing protein [Mogibacterium sp.]